MTLQPFCHRLEQLISHRVADRIIDLFETVQIDGYNRHQAMVALRMRQFLGQAVEKQLAVGQVGQHVVIGGTFNLAIFLLYQHRQLAVQARQRFVCVLDVPEQPLLSLRQIVVPERIENIGGQRCVIPRFGDEFVYRAVVDGIRHGTEVGITAENHAYRSRVEFFYHAEKFHAGHFRHALVGNNHADLVLRQQIQTLLPAVRAQDGITVAPQ